MEPTRPLGMQWPSVRARKKIDDQGLPCSPIFDDNIWRWRYIRLNGQKIRTGVAGAKKRSRKVKRKVLREERRKVEKRPLSRLQISITAIRLRHVVGKHHESYPTVAIL